MLWRRWQKTSSQLDKQFKFILNLLFSDSSDSDALLESGFSSAFDLNNLVSNSDESNEFNTLVLSSGFAEINFTFTKDCTPNFVCTAWSDCNVDYSFVNLMNNEVQSNQFRYCKDINNCFPNFMDKRICDNKENVSITIKARCNQTYIELMGEVEKAISRLTNNNKKSFMNIEINIIGDGYCGYCYNNIKDYDEKDVDCGGSCPRCL